MMHESVMSYVPGKSIDKYLDAHNYPTLDDQQCNHIWQGAAAGLAWIHGKGILYNDLKPANTIYHAEQQRAVLVDLGIADRADMRFFPAGTPWYIAPKCQQRRRFYTSNMWALGVLMLFALRLMPLPESTEASWNLRFVFEPTTEDAMRMAK